MIFNKANNGSEELKQHIGFIYKSVVFANLTTYVNSALRDLKKLISGDLYDDIEAFYLSDDFGAEIDEDDKDKEVKILLNKLVLLTQSALAFGAYRRYAPFLDVTHSDKGRQIFVSDEEKPAFEWQIERDNANLLSLEFEQIETLLEFLFANLDAEPIVSTFAASDNYLKLKSLFICDVETFEQVFPINGSRRLLIQVAPFMREVQNKFIRPCFTSDNWDALKEKYVDGDITEETPDDLTTLELLRVPLCLMTMSIAAKRLSVQVLPDSVVRNYVSERMTLKANSAALRDERMEFAKILEKEAYNGLRSLQHHLSMLTASANNTTFEPEDLTANMLPEKKYINL